MELPGLFCLERGPVRVEMSAAGAETAKGPDKGMLNLSVLARYDCGWVSLFCAPTRFPVESLQTDGRRALRYLMDHLHGPVSSGDLASFGKMIPRLRLLGPRNFISLSGVDADDAIVAHERTLAAAAMSGQAESYETMTMCRVAA